MLIESKCDLATFHQIQGGRRHLLLEPGLNFSLEDEIELHEWDAGKRMYTGQKLICQVTCINYTKSGDPVLGFNLPESNTDSIIEWIKDTLDELPHGSTLDGYLVTWADVQKTLEKLYPENSGTIESPFEIAVELRDAYDELLMKNKILKFNTEFCKGERVQYFPVLGGPFELCTTNSEAFISSSGQPTVLLIGTPGYVHIDHIRKADHGGKTTKNETSQSKGGQATESPTGD